MAKQVHRHDSPDARVPDAACSEPVPLHFLFDLWEPEPEDLAGWDDRPGFGENGEFLAAVVEEVWRAPRAGLLSRLRPELQVVTYADYRSCDLLVVRDVGRLRELHQRYFARGRHRVMGRLDQDSPRLSPAEISIIERWVRSRPLGADRVIVDPSVDGDYIFTIGRARQIESLASTEADGPL